jgi:acyl-CoA reductase-like NAD-dependent aldehyde dehydrogenase
MLIGGELMEGTGEPIQVVNPATEEAIGDVASATSAEVERAVAAARGAFRSWRKTPAPSEERCSTSCPPTSRSTRSHSPSR